jgi:thiamine kinase-like enzyme
MRRSINKDLLPSLDEIIEWGAAAAGKEGISFSSELKREERTLSPSDYGFHNSLKKDDGKIVFLDYEYFGWDDPAKLISDFLLHPAMGLSEGLKRRFVNGAIKKFAKDPKLGKRMEIVYPLFGIKWCLILLNEFLPEHMGRRRFAKKGEIDNKKILIEQLAKSEEMLRKVSGKYKRFPYFG